MATRHKWVVGLLAVVSLGAIGFFAKLAGSEFVNSEDRGQFVVEVELPGGTALEETSRVSALAEQKLLQDKEVVVVFSTIGPLNEANKALWRVVTTPKDKRSVTIAALKEKARQAVLTTVPDVQISITDPPFVEGAAVEAPIMIDVRGNTYEDIVPVSQKITHLLRTTPGVQDVRMKFSPGRPELQVSVDRDRAADKGLPLAPIALALRTAMEGEEAGTLRQGKDEVPIRVRLIEPHRDRPEEIASLTLATPRGLAKLADVARFSRGEGPQVIERENRSRQIAIWGTPTGRPLGDIVAEIQPAIDKMKLPNGTSIAYDGQIRLMSENNEAMGTALLLGVLFIYIILASQFESFIHPLTIMVSLPLALLGAIMGLFLTRNTMAMGAMIGIILLMGLVTKNAILLIDRAIVRVRDHGETPLQAIREAGPERLRPILMTSAAMVLGMMPTAVGKSEGSEFRAPMAIAVIVGVISSTLLSLVVVPVFYLTIEGAKAGLKRFWRWLWRRRTSAGAPGVRMRDAAE